MDGLLEAFQSRSSSSSSSSYGFTYDVFLSFRGTDTRYGFTGNLYKALSDKGIRTFIDDRELHGGDEITPSLLKAIEDSRIFIPVFSINYAYSSFCLDELVHIMECSKTKGRLVLPVFYGVDPSHVRHQTGSYGKAIAKREQRFQNKYTRLINILLILFLFRFLFLLYSHGFAITYLLLLPLPLFLLQNNNEDYTDNMERLRKWKMALHQAANLSGHYFNPRDGYEHEVVRKIVKEVSNKINRAPLHIADYPVGLESRVLKVNSLLDVGSDDGVYMVGIHGIGGMGKSTLARAIYNLIADQFEGLCFLDDVREKSFKHGLVHLQETLLYETVGEKDIKLGSVNKGIPIIKQRLHRKKVLLILDDVDKLDQLHFLAGGPDWFGLGSRVIVTTQDKHLLAGHGIERTYEVGELNEEEALELLRWKAFKSDKVDPCYKDILNRVVTYASGLPLALEVVGSDLFGKPREHWKSALDRYRKIPNNEIQKTLKVSFDGLEKDQQSVFLDIACCFKGHKLAEVEDILHAHYGDNMKYHIGVLVEKSLIKIDKQNWSYTDHVTLHDLIADMGKEIVRQESPREPRKRSRLWFSEDIIQVFEENKKFVSLKFLNLDNCDDLIHIPDVSGIPNLEEFSFRNCRNLLTIHNFFGCLTELERLDVEGSEKLKSLPSIKLTSLQQLNLSYCECLKSFPHNLLDFLEQKEFSIFQLKNVREGVSMIKDRLSRKDVLLTLDDVDSLDQLEALGRGPRWRFSSGSRVIITTQDRHLLTYRGKDMLLYDVRELNDKDALELLSHRAFEHGNTDPSWNSGKMLEVDSTVCRAEWSNLPRDLVSQIANSMGPFGYLSFCLVCKNWRNATLKASREYKFSRCQPCFLLYGGESSVCSLLSNDEKIYAIDIPELNEATCLASYGGWLLVFRGGSLFFFCPFSRSQIELPNCPFTKLTDHHIAAFSSAPTSQDCIVVVIKRSSDYELQLHMLCRGDNIWAKHSVSFYRQYYFSAWRVAFFFEGEFIFMDENGSVTFDAANTKQWNNFYFLYGTVSIIRSKEVKRKLGIDANVSISTCGTLYQDTSDEFHSVVIKSEYIEAATAFESGHLKGVWVLPRCHHIPPDQSW